MLNFRQHTCNASLTCLTVTSYSCGMGIQGGPGAERKQSI